MSERNYRIELSGDDLGQLLDGLEVRAESWERTESYLLSGGFGSDEPFIVEDCHKPEEAREISTRYGSIINRIRDQMQEQS